MNACYAPCQLWVLSALGIPSHTHSTCEAQCLIAIEYSTDTRVEHMKQLICDQFYLQKDCHHTCAEVELCMTVLLPLVLGRPGDAGPGWETAGRKRGEKGHGLQSNR